MKHDPVLQEMQISLVPVFERSIVPMHVPGLSPELSFPAVPCVASHDVPPPVEPSFVG